MGKSMLGSEGMTSFAGAQLFTEGKKGESALESSSASFREGIRTNARELESGRGWWFE